jgi:hypothetical protein
MPLSGWSRPSFLMHWLNRSRSFRAIDRLDARADQRRAGLVQTRGEVQRRLPAELHDDAFGLHDLDDVHHVFVRERLEEQVVARVVVGRDGLGVRVDHHRFAVDLLHRERGVHAAVVELDALSDAVRAAAEDHHARLLARAVFVLVFPGRVVVRRRGFELGGAGVDELVRRAQARVLAQRR